MALQYIAPAPLPPPSSISFHSFISQQLSKAIHTDLKTKRENVKKTSFWVPVCTPEARDTGIDKVGREGGGGGRRDEE
jgi:hypothetical protein